MSDKPAPSARRAIFLEGSTMRHVVVMTVTSAIGLIAIFFVDAISLFYISQLNDAAQTAAVGRASYVLAFVIAVSVGLMIGASVLVARAIGARQDEEARAYAGSAVIAIFLFNLVFMVILMASSDFFLGLLGAEGEALDYARIYLMIVLSGTPFMGLALVSMGILRALGDPRRAMTVTLVGGILTALLDPIFIFVLDLQVVGAAIVSLIVWISFAVLGLYFLMVVHNALSWSGIRRFGHDVAKLAKYGVPAMITNLAAPFGAFLIAGAIAGYGDEAIAGQAVVDRLIPLAFGVIFALSGAVGPIVGQNAGAGKMGRVRETMINGMIFNIAYVAAAWALLFLGREAIIFAYSATGDMAMMIDLFCTILAGSFLFNGLLFITNATFNNLGHPLWATALNWLRQTVGVIPFIWIGGLWGGIPGIILGATLGSIPFALLAVFAAFKLVKRLSPPATQAA